MITVPFLRMAGTTAGRVSGLPAMFQPVLARLTTELPAHFGSGDARLEPVECRERPFSYMLRAAVMTDGSSKPLTHVFVKIFKVRPDGPGRENIGRRVAREFESTRKIQRAMSAWPDLGAVRPIACYPEHLASVTEEMPGETLLDYLSGRASWAPQRRTLDRLRAIMEKAGRWVRAFQSIEPPTGRVTAGSIRAYVDVRLDRLLATPAARFGPVDRARVLAHIERLAAGVDPADLAEGLVHADLAPANMLVSGDRVVVLDFAMCSRGSVFHDLSRLFLQVDLLRLKPQFRGVVIDLLVRSLLAGFDPQLTADRPIFRLLLLQHRINHLATLSLSKEGFPASLYNRHVRRYHRALLESELQRSLEVGART